MTLSHERKARNSRLSKEGDKDKVAAAYHFHGSKTSSTKSSSTKGSSVNSSSTNSSGNRRGLVEKQAAWDRDRREIAHEELAREHEIYESRIRKDRLSTRPDDVGYLATAPAHRGNGHINDQAMTDREYSLKDRTVGREARYAEGARQHEEWERRRDQGDLNTRAQDVSQHTTKVRPSSNSKYTGSRKELSREEGKQNAEWNRRKAAGELSSKRKAKPSARSTNESSADKPSAASPAPRTAKVAPPARRKRTWIQKVVGAVEDTAVTASTEAQRTAAQADKKIQAERRADGSKI